MENGGEGGGFSYMNNASINSNYFLHPTTPHTTAIDRFLLSGENNQIPQQSLPFTPSSYCYNLNNNVVLDSPNMNNGNHFSENEAVSWPSQAQLSFSHGQLLDRESIKRNDYQRGILPNLICKENGKNELIKGQWTDEEDRKLLELVNKYGERSWTNISEEMYGRAGKQCRERWQNHLRSNIKKEPWTEAEERLLIETHKKVENRWAEIAKMIPGRTENAVKNHWHATKRKLDYNLSSRKIIKRKYNKADKKKQATNILHDYIISYYGNKPTNSSTSQHPTTMRNIINGGQDNNPSSSSVFAYDQDDLSFFNSSMMMDELRGLISSPMQ